MTTTLDTAPVVHGSFEIVRRLKASPSRVFIAWADPASRHRWFVEGEGRDLAEYTQDFRVGGQERGRFRFAPGQPVFHNHTVFLDIVDGHRIVFAYTMGYDNGPFSASLATVEIMADGAGTRLVFTEQAVFFEGGDDADIRKQGWVAILDAMERELARGV